MLVVDAIRDFGYDDTEDGVACAAYFDDAARCRHLSLSALAGSRMEDFTDLYVATGLFRPKTLSPTHGRNRENLSRVLDIPLDFDLTTYIGVSKVDLFTYSDEDLDDAAVALGQDVTTLALVPLGLSPSRVVMTGYGVQMMFRLDEDAQKDIDGSRVFNRILAHRINELWGGELADPQVVDAGTRIVRVPGCINSKGASHGRIRHAHEMARSGAFLEWDQIQAMVQAWQVPRRAEPGSRQPVVLNPMGVPPDTRDALVRILSSVWAEGQRHSVALGVAGLFARSGVSEEDTRSIMEVSCDGDPELRDRLRAVQTTYDHYRAGRPVAGYTVLVTTLHPDAMRALERELYPVYQAVRSSQETRVRLLSQGVEIGPGFDQDHPDGPPGRVCDTGDDGARNPRFRQVSDEAFSPWFREYRDLMRPTTEASDDYHLAASLVMAGLTIGRRAWVYHGARLFGNLYAVLVGDTGRTRKSTAINRAAAFFALHNPGSEWSRSLEMLDGLSSAEGLLDHMAANPTLLVTEEEFTNIMHKGRQSATENLLPTLTRLWDARDSHSLRTRSNPIHVDLPTLGLLSATTPQSLSDDVGERQLQSGFANRILFVYGYGKPRIANPPMFDHQKALVLLTRFRENIRALRQPTQQFTVTNRVERLWEPIYDHIYETDYPTQAAAHMAQRIQDNIFKVALIHAVANGDEVIDEQHFLPAKAFVMTAFANVSEHAATWGATDEAKLANAVLDALADSGPMTRAELFFRLGRRVGFPVLQRTLESGERMGVLHADIAGVVRNGKR
jgi:hypothetical protein